MTIQGILMLVVFLSVLTAFAIIVKHLYSLMRKGKPEERFDRWGERIKAVLVYVFGQARVLSQPAGLGHFLIFWGFIFITIGTAEHILSMIIPGFSLSLIVGRRIAEAIVFLQDIFGILVIGAIVVSLVRRFFFKPIRLKIDDPKAPREAVFILVLIFILILLMYVSLLLQKIKKGLLEPLNVELTFCLSREYYCKTCCLINENNVVSCR